MKKTTKQDYVRNPTGKGGFQDHPELRSPGGWKKEDSVSYQYNKLLRMNDSEFKKWRTEVLESGEATQAQRAAYMRIKAAISADDTVSLPSIKEITDRTEGKAPQFIGLGGENEYKAALVEFVGGDDDGKGKDSNPQRV